MELPPDAYTAFCGLDLDQLDDSYFQHREYPREAGYCAITRLVFGNCAVPMLLDYGASCSAL